MLLKANPRNISAFVLYDIQGVIQDFEIEGGNEKSNQRRLLKKGQLLIQYPAMDTRHRVVSKSYLVSPLK